jgi:hypothetical protein
MTTIASARPSGDFDRITGTADGAITHPNTVYFEIALKDQEVTSLQLHTPDAAANSAYTLEGTNFDMKDLATDAVNTKWVPIPITVTAPVAATGQIISFSNLGIKRLRLKVVTSATTQLQLRHSYLPC